MRMSCQIVVEDGVGALMRGDERRYLLRRGCRLGVGRADPTRAGECNLELRLPSAGEPAFQPQGRGGAPLDVGDREIGGRAPQLRRAGVEDLAVAPHDIDAGVPRDRVG